MSNTDSTGTAQWVEIRRDGNGKLLCRLDPPRCLLEIVDRRVPSKIDLTEYGLVFEKPAETAQQRDLT